MKKFFLIIFTLLFSAIILWLGFFVQTYHTPFPKPAVNKVGPGGGMLVAEFTAEFRYGLPFTAYSKWKGFAPPGNQYDGRGLILDVVIILVLIILFAYILNKLLNKLYGQPTTKN